MEKGRNQAQKTEMSLLQGHFWTFTKSEYYFDIHITLILIPVVVLQLQVGEEALKWSETLFL